MSKTVLVLGAGASQEAGLPVGDRLREMIATLLSFTLERGRIVDGDEVLHECIRISAAGHPSGLDGYLKAARQIVRAMPQVLSIDNFLHQRRDDPLIGLCGKLAIVRAILDAEKDSKLTLGAEPWRDEVQLERLNATWFNRFFQLFTAGCGVGELPERFSHLAVVCFNYDRCFEHFLFHSLKNVYDLTDSVAASLVSNIQIYHPYGKVGKLPWQPMGNPAAGSEMDVVFGADVAAFPLIDLVSQIKTFTESTDPESSEIVAIRETVTQAGRLIYLGFGFIEQNLEVMYGSGPESGRAASEALCWGSAYQISQANRDMIRDRLINLGPHAYDKVRLEDATCSDFVNANSRAFSFLQ